MQNGDKISTILLFDFNSRSMCHLLDGAGTYILLVVLLFNNSRYPRTSIYAQVIQFCMDAR